MEYLQRWCAELDEVAREKSVLFFPLVFSAEIVTASVT